MQPLAHQVGESTCWIASVFNAVMFLRKGERIGHLEYKCMHSTLNYFLRREGVRYDTDEFCVHKKVKEMLGELFALRVCTQRGADVVNAIRHLHFEGQVAICDVGKGDHSILLNGKSECGSWLSAFDPWWYEAGRGANENVRFPRENIRTTVNVEIRMRHLLQDPYAKYKNKYRSGRAYPMGKKKYHCLTVIESTT